MMRETSRGKDKKLYVNNKLSQVPFSSVNIGIPHSKDAALIRQVFLEEYEKGLGKGEQPICPKKYCGFIQ